MSKFGREQKRQKLLRSLEMAMDHDDPTYYKVRVSELASVLNYIKDITQTLDLPKERINAFGGLCVNYGEYSDMDEHAIVDVFRGDLLSIQDWAMNDIPPSCSCDPVCTCTPNFLT